ncbi:MAG: CDP-alcohol phosphatidyltransferase family protein [Gemmatimonadota bacterium]
MVAHLLTGVRLLLVVPAAFAFAGWPPLGDVLPALLVAVAIATDYYDGVLARVLGTASPAGRLFDHTTDFLFVTSGLFGAAATGAVTWVLPTLIVFAFAQYVLDSYLLHREKQLRMSRLGRWNGVLYFAPLVIIALARLPVPRGIAGTLLGLAAITAWALALSTVASIVDRALATRTSPSTGAASTGP